MMIPPFFKGEEISIKIVSVLPGIELALELMDWGYYSLSEHHFYGF